MQKKLLLISMLLLSLLKATCQNRIVVVKQDFKLYVLSPANDTLYTASVAIGKNYGNKKKKGDCKTPEGVFRIVQIQHSDKWAHDFHDGKGAVKGAYGPYFIRLKTPITKSIGIHGTCYPETIGTRSSEGCVRLTNDDIVEVVKYVHIGDLCEILSELSN